MTNNIDSTNLLERLFAAGAHFGFSKSRRHPSIKPYLFGNKQGNDIIDLEKTAVQLEEAKAVLNKLGSEGKIALLVSTKEETKKLVRAAAEKRSLPFVTNRWIGGMMTNYPEIKKRIERLKQLTTEGQSGELERKYTKKERVMLNREVEKLNFNFSGISNIDRVPHLLVVVDPRHDAMAVKEAAEMGVPVIGILNSDNDATKVTYPVVINDALQSSVSLVLNELIEAFVSGSTTYSEKPAREIPRRRVSSRM